MGGLMSNRFRLQEVGQAVQDAFILVLTAPQESQQQV